MNGRSDQWQERLAAAEEKSGRSVGHAQTCRPSSPSCPLSWANDRNSCPLHDGFTASQLHHQTLNDKDDEPSDEPHVHRRRQYLYWSTCMGGVNVHPPCCSSLTIARAKKARSPQWGWPILTAAIGVRDGQGSVFAVKGSPETRDWNPGRVPSGWLGRIGHLASYRGVAVNVNLGGWSAPCTPDQMSAIACGSSRRSCHHHRPSSTN